MAFAEVHVGNSNDFFALCPKTLHDLLHIGVGNAACLFPPKLGLHAERLVNPAVASYLYYWLEDVCQVRPLTKLSYSGYIEGHIMHSRLGSLPMKRASLIDFQEFFNQKAINGRLDGKPGIPPEPLRAALWYTLPARRVSFEGFDFSIL